MGLHTRQLSAHAEICGVDDMGTGQGAGKAGPLSQEGAGAPEAGAQGQEPGRLRDRADLGLGTASPRAMPELLPALPNITPAEPGSPPDEQPLLPRARLTWGSPEQGQN